MNPDPNDARWSARSPVVVGVACLALLLGGFGAWATATEIKGAVVSHGQVAVAQNRQVVQHLDGGVVAEIAVVEGERVEQGDLLIRLDDDQLRSELAIVEGQLLEILSRRARLEAEELGRTELAFDPLLLETDNPVAESLMSGSWQLFMARLETLERATEQLERQKEQIAEQIVGIEAQSAAVAEQLALIEPELAKQQSLHDAGLAPWPRVLDLQTQRASLAGRQGELAASIAQSESRSTEIEIEMLGLQSERREEASSTLRDLSYNEIELREKRQALLVRLDRLEIRAPVAGIVYGMTVFAERAVIRPADPLLYLVPQDRPLVVATQVEPINVDEVFVGQEVELRLSSFNQRDTPPIRGRVVQVSADAFQDEASQRSFYRVEVEIEPGEIEKLPEGSPLIPGMPVEAFIETKARTPLSFLVSPLSDYFTKAFRET